MKKYVKAQKSMEDIRLKLVDNLQSQLLDDFEDSLALVMSGKDGYDAEYAPGDYGSHPDLEEHLDEARNEYLSALAHLMLAEYTE